MSSALARAPTCFERERKLGPLQVILAMQAAHFAGSQEGGQSWEDGLASVVNSVGADTAWGRRFTVSRAAFHEAIKKIDVGDESLLWQACQSMFPTPGSTLSAMHGVRFAHVDGTQLRVARSAELLKVFGTQSNGPHASSHYPAGKCVVMLEAGTQRVLGHELCRCKAFAHEKAPLLAHEEREAWRRIRARNTEKYAIIADCGFASYQDFAALLAADDSFIIAVSKSWKVITKFRAGKKSEAVVTVQMPQKPERTLTLRIFTIKDGEGKTRYIATNLRHPFTLSECRRLYKTRWSIETWFRYAKQFLALRKLRSTTLRGVRLEILAILMVMQAIAAIRAVIALHTNHISNLLCTLKEGFRKAKFRTALRATCRALCDVLTASRADRPPPEFRQLLETTIAYKPGRKFLRVGKSPDGVFIPRRPSRSQRKAMKGQSVTR